MWIAGVQQGLMWRDTAADGTLFLSGVFVMAWNVWKTVSGAQAINPPIPQDDPHAARTPAIAAAPATV
ncbi:cbb3-type cytochrome c oxidase subunit I [Achromobacter xylosoxidans]|nr:cbb3-type cytochrome c oxidase subunit I [Achromobacter xylosoxidans]